MTNYDIMLVKSSYKGKISRLEDSKTDLGVVLDTVTDGSSNCKEKDTVIEKIGSLIDQIDILISRYETDMTYIEEQEEQLQWLG